MKKTISIAAALAVAGATILPTAAHAATESTGDAPRAAQRSVNLDTGAISTNTVTFPEGGTWSKVSIFHTWKGNQAFYRFV